MFTIHPSLIMQIARLVSEDSTTQYYIKSQQTPMFTELLEVSSEETNIKIIRDQKFTNQGTEISFSNQTSLVIMENCNQQDYKIVCSELERIVIKSAAKQLNIL
ncbi:hypothetical protein SS50377_27863 [Spironucleus salmonicida]|uniref:Uncharacterized protein n=1 Tax=Spironucleus salmonicida TaxID=348837 RepID=A0A9P8LKL7_9EUKA|nr:hypothetical protein SS50377_27863 [Spironucleus salmonicida]